MRTWKRWAAFFMIVMMLTVNLFPALAAEEEPELKGVNAYTLTIETTGDGEVEVNGEGEVQNEAATYTIDAGKKVLISLKPADGYEVKEMLLDEEPVTEDAFIMPEKDAALFISFSKQETEENSDQTEKLSEEEIQKKREEIKKSYFPPSKFRRAKKTVYLSVGREIQYNGYSTNYFEIEGNGAWCLEPSRATPGNGYYSTQDLDNQSDLARAMYYSVSAPGESALYEWFGSEGYRPENIIVNIMGAKAP